MPAGVPPEVGRRVLVAGGSGMGKSTLAAELARRLGVPHVELDALYHGPGWTAATDEDFQAAVTAATAGDGWVVDGNYGAVRDIVWARADTFVWLDYARWFGTFRVVRRTARRLARRTELWNGNRELLRTVLSAEHPIRWSWDTHAERRALYERYAADPRWSHVTVVRLRTAAETRRWLG